MSYRLTEHESKAIGEALASLEAVADQMQARLNVKANMIRSDLRESPSGFGLGSFVFEVAPGLLGVLLSEGRTVDTLERVCSDLAGILNRPPVEPDPIPPSRQEAA